MNLPARTLAILTGSIGLLLSQSQMLADSSKASNTTALNLPGSWTNATVPTSVDLAIWDSTISAANNSPLGGETSWLGIKVTNVGGAANGAVLMTIGNASSANTLTLGAGGVDMSAATQAMAIQAKIAIADNQTWNIANANTGTNPAGLNISEDLAFLAQVAGTAVNLGGFTVNKTGAGIAAFSSGHTISNGTFNVNAGILHFQSGGSRVETLNSDVNLVVNNGGTLALAVQSAAVNVNAQITLNAGSALNFIPGQANALTLGATGTLNVAGNTTINVAPQFNNAQNAGATLLVNSNISGAGNITYNNTLSTVVNRLRLAGDNSGYAGTLTMAAPSGNSRFLRLQSATAGSAAATWAINAGNTLEIDGVSVQLGSLNGAGTVTNSHAANAAAINVGAGTFGGVISNGTQPMALTKVGAGTLTLSGANTYTGATSVNNGTLITSPAQTGATSVNVADGATFGVKLASAGTTFNVTSLTTGVTTGASLSFDTGALGNPTAAVINAATFTPTAATVLRLFGSNLTAGPQFTLLDYTGSIGGTGFGGLSLVLPFRVTGNLVDNGANTSVDAIITGTTVPAWRGTINNNWDVDSVGDGSTGTPNWFAPGGPNTYVQGAPVGTDAVLFDDTVGAGPTNVNLTTTLTPTGITVNNTAVNYTFSGPGKISGTTGITKSGNGTLIIVNTTANDYSGTTTINAGTLQIGDGATAGAGSIGGGTVVDNGTLALNRPDDFSISGVVNGTGGVIKDGAGTATFAAANTVSGSVTINAGKLRFAGGGNLSGVVSGAGQIENSAGTLQLSGFSANTNTGLTTISGGLLQLNKAGVDAVGGDITISGGGQLALLAGEQIPNTSTINFIGSSADSIPTQAGGESVANVIVNSSVSGAGGGQVIMRNGFDVLGTATVNSGILGVGSGQTATVNAINITATDTTSALVRIAGNTAGSTLNVGAGGITASGGNIQVKFNTNDQDAVLNLDGDFTATGNVIITNGGYNGPNLNIINLTATRTFNIAAGTTTTVTPDFGGPGGLTKTGGGILSLEALSAASFAGDTLVSAGTLAVKGSISVTPNITVQNGATLDVSAISGGLVLGSGQALRGGGMVLGDIFLGSGSELAPGESVGTITFGGNLNLGSAITPMASGALGFELDVPGSSDQVILSSGILSIGAGQLEFDDFNFTPLSGFGLGDYTLFDTTMLLSGDLGPNTSGLIGIYSAELQLGDSGNDLVLHVIEVIPEPGTVSLLLAALGTFASLRPSRRRIVQKD